MTLLKSFNYNDTLEKSESVQFAHGVFFSPALQLLYKDMLQIPMHVDMTIESKLSPENHLYASQKPNCESFKRMNRLIIFALCQPQT